MSDLDLCPPIYPQSRRAWIRLKSLARPMRCSKLKISRTLYVASLSTIRASIEGEDATGEHRGENNAQVSLEVLCSPLARRCRHVPVGVIWGNEVATQQWINTSVGTPQHLGFEGRLNGPVDNPKSSCMSCHATAQTPAVSPMIPPSGDTTRWFKNYLGSQPFDAGSIPTLGR